MVVCRKSRQRKIAYTHARTTRERDETKDREREREREGVCATGAHLARKLLSCFFGTVVDISVGGLIPTAVVSATYASNRENRRPSNPALPSIENPWNSYETCDQSTTLRATIRETSILEKEEKTEEKSWNEEIWKIWECRKMFESVDAGMSGRIRVRERESLEIWVWEPENLRVCNCFEYVNV